MRNDPLKNAVKLREGTQWDGKGLKLKLENPFQIFLTEVVINLKNSSKAILQKKIFIKHKIKTI